MASNKVLETAAMIPLYEMCERLLASRASFNEKGVMRWVSGKYSLHSTVSSPASQSSYHLFEVNLPQSPAIKSHYSHPNLTIEQHTFASVISTRSFDTRSTFSNHALSYCPRRLPGSHSLRPRSRYHRLLHPLHHTLRLQSPPHRHRRSSNMV